MPIYEYRCDACGHQQEFLQRISEAPLKKCPACGKPKLKKLLSAAGFQLKGSGWYVTDFRDNKSKAAASNGKTEKAESAKTAESGAKESKSESSKSEAPAAKASAGSAAETK